TVETADTGLEAIDKAVDLRPSVIVMDLSMPGMDGWRATRWLKAHRPTRRIPVVALTSHAFTGAEAKARAAGCDLYISKPCLPAAEDVPSCTPRTSRPWRS